MSLRWGRISISTTLCRSHSMTTVLSDPLLLRLFQQWSKTAARQRAECWASHPIGSPLTVMEARDLSTCVWIWEICCGYAPTPPPHPSCCMHNCGVAKHPLSFSLWKKMMADWCMTHGNFLSQNYTENLKKKRGWHDSCITNVAKKQRSQFSCAGIHFVLFWGVFLRNSQHFSNVMARWTGWREWPVALNRTLQTWA